MSRLSRWSLTAVAAFVAVGVFAGDVLAKGGGGKGGGKGGGGKGGGKGGGGAGGTGTAGGSAGGGGSGGGGASGGAGAGAGAGASGAGKSAGIKKTTTSAKSRGDFLDQFQHDEADAQRPAFLEDAVKDALRRRRAVDRGE